MDNKTPLIYQKIGKIMREIDPITKDRTNQQQGFKYRGIDDIYNALHTVFSENGVFAVPTVLSCKNDERQTAKGGTLFYTHLDIRYTFYAEDGSSIECIVRGEAMDSADKSTNKAMSVAYKYALMQILMIPTEEDKDPDGNTTDPVKPKQPKQEPVQLTELLVNTENYTKVVDALKSGKYKIDDVKRKYKLSTDLEIHLSDIKPL